jgi:hypothetical protein
MTEVSPEQRRAVVEAIAGYLAARRIQPGQDWDTVLAECIAEVDADPQTDQDIAFAATAPPPEQWDPETTRALRRMLREAARPVDHP